MSMNRLIAPAMTTIIILISSLAHADPDVSIRKIPLSSGVVPDDRVLIGNASGYRLSVWISTASGVWKQHDIRPEYSILIRRAAATVAIATTDDDDDADAPPPVAPGDIGGERLIQGLFHYANLKGGTRAIFCWAPAKDRWMVQAFGERVCG